MLDLFAGGIEHIARIEHAKRPDILIDDGNVLQAAFLHDDRPDPKQGGAGTAEDDGPSSWRLMRLLCSQILDSG
jgi:hypothetical protein